MSSFLRGNLMGLLALAVASVPLLFFFLDLWLCRGGACPDEAGVSTGLMVLTSPLALIVALVALSTSKTVSARVLAYVSLALSTVLLWVSCQTISSLG